MIWVQLFDNRGLVESYEISREKIMGEMKERNTGIELLRIVAMISIMILHVLGNGGVLNVAEPLSRNYEATWAMEIICYFGVTAYALISGYVGIKGNFHFTNIIYLWLQVFFYSFIYTVGFMIFKPEAVSSLAIICAFFPIMTESFWYFSAYAGMFLLIPAIKHVVNNAPKKYLDLLIAGIVVFFSVLPVFFSSIDVFGLHGGSSFVWLSACFFVGAYIRKFDCFSKVSNVGLVFIYAGAVTLTFLSKYLIEVVYGVARWNVDRANLLVSYNSPTIFVSAIALVILFSRFSFDGVTAKIIKCVAPLTFGVYLSNSQPLVWVYVMRKRFAELSTYPVWKLIICTVLSALFIFFVGIAMDAIRNLIFELGGLKKKLRALENYLINKYEKQE